MAEKPIYKPKTPKVTLVNVPKNWPENPYRDLPVPDWRRKIPMSHVVLPVLEWLIDSRDQEILNAVNKHKPVPRVGFGPFMWLLKARDKQIQRVMGNKWIN